VPVADELLLSLLPQPAASGAPQMIVRSIAPMRGTLVIMLLPSSKREELPHNFLPP
jgi:hypothetical protein